MFFSLLTYLFNCISPHIHSVVIRVVCVSDVYLKQEVPLYLTTDESESDDNRVCVYNRLSTSTAYAPVKHRFHLSKLMIGKLVIVTDRSDGGNHHFRHLPTTANIINTSRS